MNLLHLLEAKGSVETVGQRLEEAVKAHKFGVIGVIDLKGKMTEKGVPFKNECKIYEVCNPLKAKEVLEIDMRISTALPCRISVYEEHGKVLLATLLPTATLELYGAAGLEPVALEVEREIKAMMADAAG